MNQQEFKEIRLTIGLSQAQLGLKLNVGSNHISKIENGKKGITEQKEEAMKNLLRAHRLKIKKTNVYTRPKREKICFEFPWYSHQATSRRKVPSDAPPLTES